MRALILAVLFMLALPPALAQRVPLPAQPQGVDWPVADWETALLSDEVDKGSVLGLVEAAFEREKTDLMGETRALIVVHRGRVVIERYRTGYGPATKLVSWSMAKSVTHALVGRALQTGRLAGIDEAMPSPWPSDDPRAGVTWRQWLNMTDGLAYREIGADSLDTNDVAQMMYGPGRFDVVAYAAGLPQAYPPGSRWNYSTAGFHLIARALMEAIAGPPPHCTLADNRADTASPSPVTPCVPVEIRFRDWAHEALFDPLGMQTELEFDDAGTFLGGSLVWASARDFAKFGYLYLRDGVWNGERLLPEGWVDLARTPGPDARVNTYGSGFWITPPEGAPVLPEGHGSPIGPRDAFSAQGHEGQVIWIVPSRDLVIVRLGLMNNGRDDWQALYDWCQSIAIGFPEIR